MSTPFYISHQCSTCGEVYFSALRINHVASRRHRIAAAKRDANIQRQSSPPKRSRPNAEK